VQTLPSQQRTLAGLVQTLVLVEDLSLVLRRVPARATGSLGDLGVRIVRVVHGASLDARVQRIVDGRAHSGNSSRPLSSTNRLLDPPQPRLTQRASVSVSPTAQPRTSPSPVMLTPVTTTTVRDTTWPRTRPLREVASANR